jgi:putative redox protein
MARVTVRSERGLRQRIEAGRHVLTADEPVSAGGGDSGPDPYALLLAALGACTSMTLKLYAARKGWPLGDVVIDLEHSRVHADDCAGCERPDALVDRIQRRIVLSGPLAAEQTARLAEIARKCPVHKTLAAGVSVVDDVVLV